MYQLVIFGIRGGDKGQCIGAKYKKKTGEGRPSCHFDQKMRRERVKIHAARRVRYGVFSRSGVFYGRYRYGIDFLFRGIVFTVQLRLGDGHDPLFPPGGDSPSQF